MENSGASVCWGDSVLASHFFEAVTSGGPALSWRSELDLKGTRRDPLKSRNHSVFRNFYESRCYFWSSLQCIGCEEIRTFHVWWAGGKNPNRNPSVFTIIVPEGGKATTVSPPDWVCTWTCHLSYTNAVVFLYLLFGWYWQWHCSFVSSATLQPQT